MCQVGRKNGNTLLTDSVAQIDPAHFAVVLTDNVRTLYIFSYLPYDDIGLQGPYVSVVACYQMARLS